MTTKQVHIFKSKVCFHPTLLTESLAGVVVPLKDIAFLATTDIAALGVCALLGTQARWETLIQILTGECIIGQGLSLWTGAQTSLNTHKKGY